MNETGLNQLDSSVSDRTLTNTQTDRVALSSFRYASLEHMPSDVSVAMWAL